ncbi:MAG: methyltransferase domain-containing protein [Thermaerobacter sp.]|jgi:SAM-dependent methyltransferase|nr:methyltransferase domain-containing protein [Thermaerobacter sp.]
MDAREQFGRTAAAYVDSPVHAAGRTLARCRELAGLRGGERVLDVATGAGHLAFALASLAGEVVALDLTPAMLEVAADEAHRRGIGNVSFVQGDALDLPFPDGLFQAVLCRVAAHHFPDPARAVAEMARVVEFGGLVLVADTCVPEDDGLDRRINELELLRDASHRRNWRPGEWRGFFRRAGLTVQGQEWGFLEREMPLEEWLERAATPLGRQTAVRRRFAEADAALRAALAVREEAGQWYFQLPWVITWGRRP